MLWLLMTTAEGEVHAKAFPIAPGQMMVEAFKDPPSRSSENQRYTARQGGKLSRRSRQGQPDRST